jgi:uncharacterized protein YutE (UPF0331/DUF86 family)
MRKNLIKIKLKEIDESLKVVEENLPSSFDEFQDLGLIKDGIYKKIEFCIENVLDICAVLNSDLELGIPVDEDDIIDHLMENNLISKDLGFRIKKMKGFRNFLVHRYGKIDDKIAFENIKAGFQDFQKFEEEIKAILKKQMS